MLADIRPALRAFLLADSTLSSLVGGQRVHPVVLPQGTVAASLVYNVISEITDHHTQGSSGLVMVRVQIDAYAQLPDDADTLARAVKERIDGFRGTVSYGGSPPAGIVDVQGVFADTARTDYQSEPKLYRSSRDYLIWFGER